MSYEETDLDEDGQYGDELADAGEGQEGQCDMCLGSTEEDLKRAVESPGIIPVCACAIGQGADADVCRCGPEEER